MYEVARLNPLPLNTRISHPDHQMLSTCIVSLLYAAVVFFFFFSYFFKPFLKYGQNSNLD